MIQSSWHTHCFMVSQSYPEQVFKERQIMNILIVEDDISLSASITDAVRSWGHTAEEADTGKDALKKMNHRYFDLILLDIFLPDIKGHLLIPEMKKLWPHSNIISMTGYNSRDLEREVRKQGVIYYMIKPFDIGHLRSIIDHMNTKALH